MGEPQIVEMKENGVWTMESYAIYSNALRAADKELQTEKILHLTEVVALNDRRYTEVGVEKEKALKIKEIADLSALELARESQVNKDERNDAMREQSLKDNGIYATRDDLTEAVKGIGRELKPLVDYVSSQKGASDGAMTATNKIYATVGVIVALIGAVFLIINKYF